MAKNGTKRKYNGKRPPKGVIPPQLAAHVVKPGQVLNPKGISHKPTCLDKLAMMLEHKGTIELEDGTKLELDAETEGLRMLLDKWRKGPQHKLNDPNWRWAGQEILARRMPIPREPQVLIGNVSVEHTSLAVSFVDQVRAKAGRDNVTSDDVLRMLETETFGNSDATTIAT